MSFGKILKEHITETNSIEKIKGLSSKCFLPTVSAKNLNEKSKKKFKISQKNVAFLMSAQSDNLKKPTMCNIMQPSLQTFQFDL